MIHRPSRFIRCALMVASVAAVVGVLLPPADAQGDHANHAQGVSPLTTRASAMFEHVKWDEAPYDEAEGQPKLTRASVTKRYTGDLDGEGALEMLITHRLDGTAQFIGFERFTGTLNGHEGSFILEHTGSFAGGIAKGVWTVVAGSGTGELAALTGSVIFESGHAEQFPVAFEYALE